MILGAIPAELRALPRWVRWKAVPDKPKPKKIPIRPTDSRPASSTDPTTWGTFEEAVANVGRDGTAGVGFVFFREDRFVGIDLDDCVGEDGVLSAKAASLLQSFSTYAEESPSGRGIHLIVRGSLNGHLGLNKKRESGIEVYDSKRYFTMTGKALPGAPSVIMECQPAIDALVAELDPPRPAFSSLSTGRRRDPEQVVERARGYIARMPAAVAGQRGHDATFRVALALVKGFLLERGPALDLLSEYNARCEPVWSEKELEHKIDNARGAKVPDGYILDRSAPLPAQQSATTPTTEIVSSKDWRLDLVWKKNAKGEDTVLANHVVNATVILGEDERWFGCLALNEFSQIVEIVKRPPHEPQDAHEWMSRPLTDADLTFIAGWLAREFRLMVSPDTVAQACGAVAHRNSFHPVRAYLDSLRWDGEFRLNYWLEDFMGASSVTGSGSYVADVGRAWMISAVARIYQPGCKADHVLILEGAQGIKKSTVFETLGRPWFTDQVSDLSSKDAALQVQGVWIIELAELDAMSRHEVGRVKAFLSVSFDRIRPPYGRTVMRYDRQCVFAGTVNHTDYLRDETGNRRFWPVRCTDDRINIDGLAQSRDQLWAEAVAAYRAGERWWLEDEIPARAEQENRMSVDAWEDPIEVYLASETTAAGPLLRDRAHVTLQGILKALGLPIDRQGPSEQRRVVSILKKLGWTRRQVKSEDGSRQWRYLAPVTSGHQSKNGLVTGFEADE